MNNNQITPLSVDFSSFNRNAVYENTPEISLDEETKKIINGLIEGQNPSFASRLVQTSASSMYNMIDESLRLKISDFFKSLKKKQNCTSINLKPDEAIVSFGEKIKENFREPIIMMTHDVDYCSGYRNIEKFAKIEAERGIRACYYFLVDSSYKIEPSLLKCLCSMGHEIGLHGYTYDLRIAYRKPSEIFSRIDRAKKKLEDLLGKQVKGFRNHTLLFTHNLIDVVSRLGFAYNSGVYARNSQNGFNSYFSWPFKYKGTQLFEFPVLWPIDSDMFRKAGLDNLSAFNCIKSRIEILSRWNGVICLVNHVEIMVNHMEYFNNLINYLTSRKLKSLTPSDYLEKEEIK